MNNELKSNEQLLRNESPAFRQLYYRIVGRQKEEVVVVPSTKKEKVLSNCGPASLAQRTDADSLLKLQSLL